MEPVSAMLLGGAAWGGLNSALGIAGSAISAAEQYHYAKKMYQHRYRWARNDLEKAGYNPILAATGGSIAGMSSAPSPDYGGAMQAGVSSALSTAKAVSDLKAQQVTNEKTEADARLSDANTLITHTKNLGEQIKNEHLPVKVEQEARRAIAEASSAESAAVAAEAKAQYAEYDAYSKALEGRVDAMQKKANYYSKPHRDWRRWMWWQQQMAKLHNLRNQSLYGGWNTAAKVGGTVAKFLR